MSEANPPGQPSEEELRAYLGQLRESPVAQVVTEVVSALLNAAQVKLGRRDARVLLDLVATVTDQSRPHLPGQVATQVDEVLAQLRLAQVTAEGEVAAAAEQGIVETGDVATSDAPGAGPATPPSDGTTPPAGGAPAGGAPGGQRPPATSRLWVPGR